MSDYAIEVDNLGKRYTIGPPRTVSMRLYGMLRRQPLRRSNARRVLSKLMPQRFPPPPVGPPSAAVTQTEFWALRNVSFKVKRGEVIGIIGRNGSGKTTLLKILSRITAPSEGQALIRGQIGSLLEVGTGFHPNLSGRENIYMNGVTLGMTRGEIDERFEEIVAFAEIEDFIDTPVKYYSSGMYVRLGFAVAAHLVADVVIIDEALAVGDAMFQRKCMGRMDEIAHRGRTVLIVSHSMSLIRQLCTRAILFRSGRVERDGDINEVIEAYAGELRLSPARLACEYELDPDSPMQVTAARLVKPDRYPVPIESKLRFEIDVLTRRPLPGAYVGVGIRTQSEDVAYWTADVGSDRYDRPEPGELTLVCELPERLLAPGKYKAIAHIVVVGREVIFSAADNPLIFEVEDSQSVLALHGFRYPGYIAIPSQWSVLSHAATE